MLVSLVGDHVSHLCKRLIVTSEGQRQVRLLDLALLLWAQVGHRAVDLVHRGVLRVVLRVEKTLDAIILSELLPIVHLLEHVVHGDGDLAA